MRKSKKKYINSIYNNEKSNVNNISAICAEAKRLSMSYGKYVAMNNTQK